VRLGRSFVGIDLSEKYGQMARERITHDAPLLAAGG
jgi:DNA modification methylase